MEIDLLKAVLNYQYDNMICNQMTCNVQENISDRLGWHHTMMAVAVWPLTLHLLSDVWSQQPALVRDLEDR